MTRPYNVVLSKNFYFSQKESYDIFNIPFYRELINTKAFIRLKGISFLGAIDYLASPGRNTEYFKRQSRHDHSLGVALLAFQYSRRKELPPSAEMTLVAAALMHDIGHAPLSHTLEPVFQDHFGINHHQAGLMRLRGGRFTKSSEVEELQEVFASHKVDLDEVCDLMDGSRSHPHGFLFWHPINIDTIEGISRSRTYMNHRLSLFSKELVLEALICPESMGKTLDRFWEMKGIVYERLIQGVVGVVADEVARQHMRDNIRLFRPEDFFLNERSFRSRNQLLFEKLNDARQILAGPQITRAWHTLHSASKKRYFRIDENAPPGDPRRYQQSKTI